ncbi:transglutaminase-like domain-containing protein [Leptospira sanjuanensis]|uniref:transglutaminase-like domain-containing protein n=1 Tax=Leptospira sanjuanensis TaxID=2879643 RepID=UPI001EE82286|nr:transglutaminase-like domain-containing protein [Leptospira sanjuanensis]MCG6166871.1 transglutaminase-like domain-containing protein [Leptospira sanjuanensis]
MTHFVFRKKIMFMPSSDSYHDSLSFPPDKLEEKFYQLEFAGSDEKIRVIREIADMVPWQFKISEFVEEFKDPTLRVFARSISSVVHLERINARYAILADKGHVNDYSDLEEAVFLLSSVGDPDASYHEFKIYLDQLALRVEELCDLNPEYVSEELKVHFLTRVLSSEENFQGNNDQYDDPNNSFVTRIVRTRKGIPISLSAIYLLVARRLSLPLYGVNMPLHFLLHFDSPDYETFIDPFHGGVLLDKSTCIRFLEANSFTPSERYFTRASTLSIIKRMYRNLIHIYRKEQFRDMEDILARQLLILENKLKA